MIGRIVDILLVLTASGSTLIISGILADLEAGFRAAVGIGILFVVGCVVLAVLVEVLRRMFRA